VKKSIEKIIEASKKFIKTQARIIIACCHAGLLNKACLSFLFFNNSGLSQYNLTNQPIGNRFKENKVPFLSLKSFFALGGIPKPNSSTFTQNFLAAAKCHHSCTSTIIEKSIIDTIIQRIIIIF
jgi:hypothetical protein